MAKAPPPNPAPPPEGGPARQTGSFLPGEIGEIPRAPGVYLMFDAKGRIIYVGKAQNLRARVRQYFVEGGDERASVPLILKSLHHIETIATRNEEEAFLLENTLIKRHRPRYNVRLRDDKSYVSVRIDPDEPWPRALVTRARKGDRGRFFGPYTNAQAIRATMRLLQTIYPLRSCSDHVLRNRSRPCMLHQIGRCCAPCVMPVPEEEYAAYVRGTMLFLKGRTGELLEDLRRRMADHSERQEYEQAARLRDQIQAVEASSTSQHVAGHRGGNRDVIGFHQDQGRAAIVLQFFRNGSLVESQSWIVELYGEPPSRGLAQFLGQYYGEGRLIPPEILLPLEPDDRELIEQWLAGLREGAMQLNVPRRGGKRRLVEGADENARQALERKLSGREELDKTLADLGRRLKLDEPPARIECYDIATLQGRQTAASRVVFLDGEPHKADYRLYRIREVEGSDDFASMREVLTRRLRRAVEQGEPLPDLIVVDGGKGQLGVAEEVFEELGIQGVALAALAKSRLRAAPGAPPDADKQRSEERLFLPGRKNPVPFPPRAPSFYLLQRLRDEAHRFVNSYHGKWRRRATLRSSLEDVPGIGKTRARALLRHFGSLARIRKADVEQLAAAPGMTRAAAENVARHYRGDDVP